MNRLLIAAGGLVLAGSMTAPGYLSTASAAPNCGGQSAPPQPVPYTCVLPGIDITAQGFTRHFSAVVFADGTRVVVTYTMSAPLPVAVPIRIVHHTGISGAGGTEDTAQGTIPAGSVTATLSDSSPCRDGQLDVKAVFIANGDDRGRVGGPWIQNGTGCVDSTTTVPQSSTTSVPSPSSTVPPTVASTTPGTTPGSVETSTTGGGTLPPTGSSAGPVWVGLGLLVGGLLLLTAVVRRRAS